MLHRYAAAIAAAAVTAGLFAVMDANPSLYFYDKLLVSKRRRLQAFGGQHMWIVGASSGIGASLAHELASSGASLILSARNVANLEQVAAECRDCHPERHQPLVVPLDMSAPQEQLESTVDRVLLESGNDLDCVIFNAGIGQQSPAIDTSPKTCQDLMQVNALGIMNMATLIIKKSNWLSRKRGHFVVTSSIAAKSGVPLSAAYAASKHAIHGYMQSLQAELPWLRITLPCPGPVATNFHQTPTKQGELKMSVERCARLVLSSCIMGGETWIAQQPSLFFMYLNQYLPTLAQRILNKVGPMRVGMWREGYNIYSPSDMRAYRKRQRVQEKADE